MKKILLFLMVVVFTVNLLSCKTKKPKDIQCSEIISVYENKGYYVIHGQDCGNEEADYKCYICVKLNKEDVPTDHAYIITYWTEEAAKEAAKTDRYHIVKWIFALPFGETRWLKSGYYGKIEYSSYNSKMLKPLKSLMD